MTQSTTPGGPLRHFLARLEADPAQFLHTELVSDLGPAWEAFRAAGYIRSAAPARSAPCPGCGLDGCPARFLADRRTAVTQVQVVCGDCGASIVPAEALARWAIDVPAFLSAVGRAAKTAGPPTEVVAGCLWRLGMIPTTGVRARLAFVARPVRRSDGVTAAAALDRHPAAVLFVPTARSLESWDRPVPRIRLALSEYLAFGPTGLSFDVPAYAAQTRGDDEDRPAAPKAKPKRGSRAADIEALTREVKILLRAARDHAFDTKAHSGIPELLDRPSQAEWARLAGVNDYDVTRCLQDPDGKWLKFLWEALDDLSQVMRGVPDLED